MLTIIMNDLNIFIFPFIVGFAIRFGAGKWSKAFFITAFFTLLALAAIWAEKTIPSHGSEMYALISMETICMAAGSWIAAVIARLRKGGSA